MRSHLRAARQVVELRQLMGLPHVDKLHANGILQVALFESLATVPGVFLPLLIQQTAECTCVTRDEKRRQVTRSFSLRFTCICSSSTDLRAGDMIGVQMRREWKREIEKCELERRAAPRSVIDMLPLMPVPPPPYILFSLLLVRSASYS